MAHLQTTVHQGFRSSWRVIAHQGAHPSHRVVRGLMRHANGGFAVALNYTDVSGWHLFAGQTGTERDARWTWEWVRKMQAVREKAASVALLGPAEPSVLPTLGRQTLLAGFPGPSCLTCGATIEPHPGRPGRPRQHCVTCRPPTWPRRGETWVVDGQPMVVLGSRVRPDRSIRARPVDSALARWLEVGVEWKDARRLSADAPDPRSAS